MLPAAHEMRQGDHRLFPVRQWLIGVQTLCLRQSLISCPPSWNGPPPARLQFDRSVIPRRGGSVLPAREPQVAPSGRSTEEESRMSWRNKRRVWGGVLVLLSLFVVALVRSTATGQAHGAAPVQHPVYLLADPPKADPLAVHDISLDQANLAVQSAVEKSKSLHIYEDIAVVDAGGNLKAFARMDEAWLGSIDIAIKKAKTSRYFNMETGQIGKLSQPGQPLYMIEVSNGGLITFPGGIPIKTQDGHVIGAIGASGSSVENDEQVATAGAQAVTQSQSSPSK